MIKILQTPTFRRQTKKLHVNQKHDLDTAIKEIVSNPTIGTMKKGDLAGVRVYKFKMIKQLTLLAYEAEEQDCIILLALGNHETFYRDLK
ncbi:type II toxin-antitoxin system RelE/ParE family toxin [Candidatus Babeliales bacterium]|nr:type II toxin-antitoxin system RelE/ParE family toxin [Candidatus Babeliales bacterium]